MSTESGTSGIVITISDLKLNGDLSIPARAKGIVLFAHGSGSSRFSPRERFVASKLNEQGLATLIIDLLTPEEESVDELTRELRFDIPFLAGRLIHAIEWLSKDPRTKSLPAGLFGASTGAAAALVAASRMPKSVKAVVSRGGRPDLAKEALPKVKAPTLLIVGGDDTDVIELNKLAMKKMKCEVKIEIIPGATHLFEEPGALDKVAELAAGWFLKSI